MVVAPRMQAQPSAGGIPKRALGVRVALEWAFRVEKAQLELPQRQDAGEDSRCEVPLDL